MIDSERAESSETVSLSNHPIIYLSEFCRYHSTVHVFILFVLFCILLGIAGGEILLPMVVVSRPLISGLHLDALD
jgi:hypothetical protein